MGAESRRLVEERFDIDSVNDAMLNEMGIAPGRVGPPE
jgi:hypothetical protein